MKKLTLKEEFRYAILSAIHDEGLDISDAINSAFEAVIQPVLGSYPDEKANAKRAEKRLFSTPQSTSWTKSTSRRRRYVNPREQKEKVHLAKERGILIEKDLASKQLTFLFVA